jgi:hypothetical protein
MNAISEVSSWLTPQNVSTNYDNSNTKNGLKTQAGNETNSFLSFLNLLDVNADEKIETQELKFGAGFFINCLIQSKDLNGDEALSAEETGVSPAVVTSLDTDSDGTVSAKELITPASAIIDGVMSVMDIDGDQALSQSEMAIFELLFSSLSSSSATTESDTNTLFTSSGSSDGSKLELDMNTLPDAMRQAGFQGRDNLLYYALASTYADWPWQPDSEDPDSVRLSEQRGEIYEWFDKNVMDLAGKMEANPALTVTAITNDGLDKCGFRLGPAITEKLQKFGDRVQLGTIYS